MAPLAKSHVAKTVGTPIATKVRMALSRKAGAARMSLILCLIERSMASVDALDDPIEAGRTFLESERQIVQSIIACPHG